MVKLQEIERQLKQIGATFSMWNWPEVRELQNILLPGEQIKAFVTGRYSGGFAVICATDARLLLVDKKVLYLTVEDIRYDMIVEVDYNYRLLDATTSIITPTNTLTFTSVKKQPLRRTTSFVQQRVMELRQSSSGQDMANAIAAGNAPTTTIPLVAMQNQPHKQFIPQLPFRNVVNPYTQTSLATRRRVSRFYPS